MKRELLCKSCGEKLRNNIEAKQMVTGEFVRFTYGPMKPTVDAQKLQCDGCHQHFKKGAPAVCFSNWERDEVPDAWENVYIIEQEHVQL